MSDIAVDVSEVLSQARAAGLAKAAERFPNDVLAAAAAATHARAAFRAADDATAEPWPPMRVPGLT